MKGTFLGYLEVNKLEDIIERAGCSNNWVRRHLLRRQLFEALFHLRCRVRVRIVIGFYVRFRVRVIVRYSAKFRAEVRHSISVRD